MGRLHLSAPGGRRLALTLGALAAAGCLVGAAQAEPPFTTAPKFSPSGGTGQAEVYGLATGCHATYDRLVLRVRFAKPGYGVRLVSQIRQDPSGKLLRLAGHARLLVVLRSARAHTTGGTSLIPAVVNPRCSNLRQVKRAGDFEGVVSLGLGLRHTAGFRVFRLTSPSRVVVDIAH